MFYFEAPFSVWDSHFPLQSSRGFYIGASEQLAQVMPHKYSTNFPSCKTTLMICFHELLITFHPCCEGLNQPFSTDTVSLQIWGWRLVSRRVNKGSSSSSGAANMDCIILQSKKRKAAWALQAVFQWRQALMIQTPKITFALSLQ